MKKPKPFKYIKRTEFYIEKIEIRIDKDDAGFFLNIIDGSTTEFSPELLKELIKYFKKVDKYFDGVQNGSK